MRIEAGALQHALIHPDEIVLIELARRQVDGDARRLIALPLPRLSLLACLAQDERAEGGDYAGMLGCGNKAVRRDQTALRMVPAHQRLHTDETPLFDADLGLVPEDELFAIDGAPELLFDGHAADRRAGTVAKLDRIAAGALHPVHRA